MTLKEKVTAKNNICGTHITFTDSAVTQIEAAVGYDYLWIDLEHTYISEEVFHNHLLAARASGTPVIVRVPVSDLTVTKRVLEMGVDGIIFPMVENYEHAKTLLSLTLYPPYGTRGCGPMGAVRYGLDDEKYYYGDGHLKMCRFLQIERKTAVDEIEMIASLPYLDGCMLGMHDLSGSINDLGNVFGDENMALALRTIAAFKARNLSVGVSTVATDVCTLTRYRDMGINMITTGADYGFIRYGALKTLETVKSVQSGLKV